MNLAKKLEEKFVIKKVKRAPRALKSKIKGELFKIEKSKSKSKSKTFIPNAIFIDGGKGQLSSAKQVLDELNLDIPLFSIAKREEEVFTIKDGKAKLLDVPRNSESLFLIQRLRDESHRFAISYNRNLRDKAMTKSVFDEIKGIGPATKKKLIRAFGSASGVREAKDEELLKFVSEKVLKKIRENL